MKKWIWMVMMLAAGPERRAVPVVCSPAGAWPVVAEVVRVDNGAGVWRPVSGLAGEQGVRKGKLAGRNWGVNWA